MLTPDQPRYKFMIAIRRGRLHSAIVRFLSLSTLTSGFGTYTAGVRLSEVLKVETPDATSTYAVVSISYGQSACFRKTLFQAKKFFELDA